MDVRLPDGTIIRNVPDGTTRAQLADKLRRNGYEVPDDWMQPSPQPQQQTLAEAAPDTAAPATAADRAQALTSGFHRGLANVAGLPVDTGANVLDLAKAGIGFGISKATGRAPPEWTEPMDRSQVVGSSEHIAGLMNRGGIQTDAIRPDDTASRALHFGGEVGAGLLTPGRSPARAPAVHAPSRAEQAIAAGERHGVPVFYDDVSGSAVARRVGVAAEPLGPLGTGSGRAAQAKAAQGAAQRVVNQFAPNTADDVPELVQQGLKTKLGQFRGAAARLYERAANALDPAGSVPTNGMDSVISRELQRQQSLGTLANQDVITLLQKYQQAPRGNFSAMRELRSQLGSDISDFYTGANKTIGEKGVGALQAMKDSLEADMAAFAKGVGGNAEKAWRQADGFYRANIVPFKEAGFRDLVKTAEPEKAWRYLLSQGGLKSRAQRMYNSLDEAGRGAVRYGLVKEAMEAGTNPNGSFSPAKFSKYLEDHEQAVNTFFKGADRAEISGFQNLMRHVERAGQFAENPPTGQRLVPYLMAAGAALNVKGAAVTAGVGTGVRVLFQTKTGRNLLLAFSKVDPGSRQAELLSERMLKMLAAQSASAGTAGAASDPREATAQ